MRRALAAFLLSCAALVWASRATADVTQPASERALGIHAELDVAVVPLAAPSPSHLWGTVAIAWNERLSEDDALLQVGEWDLRAGRFVKVETLRPRGPAALPKLRLVRSGESLVLLTSSASEMQREELMILDLELHEKNHLVLDDEGEYASLAVSDRFVALSTFEYGGFRDGWGFHVRLLDRESLVIVAATKLATPTFAWPNSRISGHELRFDGDDLLAVFAERPNPRLVRLALPSLHEKGSAVLLIPDGVRGAYTSVAFTDTPALAVDIWCGGRKLLTKGFRVTGSTKTPEPPDAAPKAPEFGERAFARIYGHTVITGIRDDHWVISVTP